MPIYTVSVRVVTVGHEIWKVVAENAQDAIINLRKNGSIDMEYQQTEKLYGSKEVLDVEEE